MLENGRVELAHWDVPLDQRFQKTLLYLVRGKKYLIPLVFLYETQCMALFLILTGHKCKVVLSTLDGEEKKRRLPLQRNKNWLLQ